MNLFGTGSRIANVNVNINHNGGGGGMQPMMRALQMQQMMKQLGSQNNTNTLLEQQQVEEESVAQISHAATVSDTPIIEAAEFVEVVEDEHIPVITDSDIELMFGLTFIDRNYVIRFDDTFDMDIRPKDSTTPMNVGYYINSDVADDYSGPSFMGRIITDGERAGLPPLLIVSDIKSRSREELDMIDQMIYHTALIAKHISADKFYIEIETLGELEEEEPASFRSHINPEMGCSERKYWAVSI